VSCCASTTETEPENGFGGKVCGCGEAARRLLKPPVMLGSSNKVRLVGLLVPVAFTLNLALPEHEALPVGVPEALGCSGSGSLPSSPGATAPPTPQWFEVAPSQNDGKPVSVATDGFFTIAPRYYGFTEEEALAALEVIVTDEAGQDVPGKLALVEHNFTWAATTPLKIGAHLKASLGATSISSTVGGDFALEVVGEPEPLPEPSAEFYGWTKSFHGVGSPVTCGVALPGGCGSAPSMASTAYEEDGGFVDLRCTTLPKAGVLWRLSVEQSAIATDGRLYYSTGGIVTGPAFVSTQELGRVGYDLGATRACAVIVIKDLRTGKESRADTCHAVEATTEVNTNDFLRDCSSPPNEGVRELWCRLHSGLGEGCNGTAPTEPVTEPGTPGPGPVTITHADAGSRESSGCQLGVTPSPSAWWASLVALAGLVTRLRLRRKARS
jgi:hypothetical protein